MRKRRIVQLLSLVAVLSIGTVAAAIFSPAADQPVVAPERDQGVGDPEPPNEVIWEGRYNAALASVEADNQRIQDAKDAYDSDRKSATFTPRSYLVSFTHPVAARTFLQAVSSRPNVQLESIFTWQLAVGSVNPITGRFAADDLDWARLNTDVSIQRLSDILATRLIHHSQSLSRARQQYLDQFSRDVAQQQVNEVAALQADLSTRGALLYGFACLCSPSALDDFFESENAFVARAIEGNDGARTPIPPLDPLRDKIIETRGRYGRE